MVGFISHDPVPDQPGDDPALARVRFTVDTEHSSWTIAFSATNDSVGATYEESLEIAGVTSDDEALPPQDIHRPPFLARPLLALRAPGPHEPPAPLPAGQAASRLSDQLSRIAIHRPWELQKFRSHPFSDPSSDDVVLAPDGGNLFVVLQNWRDTRQDAWRFDWVLDRLIGIHGRTISGIDLKKASGALGAQFYVPGDEAPLLIKAASNGVLGTLLSLTAAAGGKEGGVVLIDEPDNGLHPSAIHGLVSAFRALFKEKGVSIVLATHSPVILNALSETPEDVWVMERSSDGAFPARLTDLRDPEWLANFRLGQIYGTGFARQDPLSGNDR
jgi:hypothetical protein